MLIMIHKAHETLLRYMNPHVGRLLSPRHFGAIERTADAGIPWAADNDCYSGFNERLFLAMMDRIAGLSGCKFVSTPDVVADSDATLELFMQWHQVIRDAGLPVAFVSQDGLRNPPWDLFDALFIGGTTNWKLSQESHALVDQAKKRGKWVHMGRVNTLMRIKTAKSWGVDSIDGTRVSRWTDEALPFLMTEIVAPTQMAFEP